MRIFIFIALLFCACSSNFPPLKNIDFTQKTFRITSQNKSDILYISKDSNAYIFALFDPLGAPLAHKKFENNKFESMKFLPPKKYYDKLFFYILTLLENKQNNGIYVIGDKTFEVKEIENNLK